jgi:hypothetical protein
MNILCFHWMLYNLCNQSAAIRSAKTRASVNHAYHCNVTCRVVGVTKAIQSTVAHALGFSVSTSRLLATDLNTEISTSNHYEVFLLFRLQSLWNLGTKNFSGLTPPGHDWLVTALNWTCFCIHFSYKHSAQAPRKTPSLLIMTYPLS